MLVKSHPINITKDNFITLGNSRGFRNCARMPGDRDQHIFLTSQGFRTYPEMPPGELTQAGNVSLGSSEGQGQEGRRAQNLQLELLPSPSITARLA